MKSQKLVSGPWPQAPQEPREASREASRERTARVLVADDERSIRELLAIVLKREGYEVIVAENGQAALDVLAKGAVDLVISDIKMPDMSGVEVLRAAKAADASLPAIMMTAFASTETAVEAMRLGACDYLIKPFDVDELKLKTGESGTGKELVARALHFHSLRRDRPFVALNCGALPETLLESELFGHMRGAFTGAESTKKGLVEVAEFGTIFLDEIGEMTPMMQVKLLRVLQERKFRRVGGTEEISADIRVVAATNQDLPKLVAEGRFREDLYYRINVIPIQLPALRERREDIPLIAEHFLAKYREQMGKTVTAVTREAMALLERYHWPGNIRELENVIERAVALERTPAILAESLPPQIRGTMDPTSSAPGDVASLPEAGFDLEQHVQNVERRYLAQALERAGGVQVRAAELLGMSFRSFRYYAKKYRLK